MAAIQERNSEMVKLLEADFVSKRESIYNFTSFNNFLLGIPGLLGLWTTGGVAPVNSLNWLNNSILDVDDDRIGLGTQDPTIGGSITPGITVAQVDNATAFAIVNKTSGAGRFAINGNTSGGFDLFDCFGGGWKIGISQYNGDLYLAGRVAGPWIGLAFTNSGGTTWTDFDVVSWQVGRYKRLGDMVFLQGLVKRTAGTGTVIANLPANYRPPRNILYAAHCDSGLCRIDVATNGDIGLQSGSAGWVSLNLPPFSTAS